jgi:hypothetical protein
VAFQIIDKALKNGRCVYWPKVGDDGQGNATFGDPVETGCFWVESIQVVTDEQGHQWISRAQVQVGVDMELEWRLWRGLLANLPDQDPDQVHDAREVKRFLKIPAGLRNQGKFYRVAYL